MTPEQKQTLENMLQIVKESAEKIINDGYSENDLLFYLYQKGFEFMQDNRTQKIIDVGSVGLAFAVMREAKK